MGDKRTMDDRPGKQAMRYAAAIITLAALFCAVAAVWADRRNECAAAATTFCDGPAQAAILAGPMTILLLGGAGAFVRTILQWRRGLNWQVWQGAGWFLFLLVTAYGGIGASSIAG